MESSRKQQHVHVVSRVTWVGLWVNVALCIAKVLAGLYGNSRAVLADGIHSLSDLVTDFALLVGVHFWTAPADADHPYGHARLETVVTVAIGLILAGAGIGIGWDAVAAFRAGEVHQARFVAFAAALASLLSKEALYRWTVREARRINSSALAANAWHHRSDALSSAPAAVAVAVSMLFPDWAFIDLLGAIVVAMFILHAAWSICYPALQMLVDKGAPKEVTDGLYYQACSVPGVRSVHRLRSRYQGAGLHVDMHIGVDSHITVQQGHDIADAVELLLLNEGPEVVEVLVHVDPWKEEDGVCTPDAPDAGSHAGNSVTPSE